MSIPCLLTRCSLGINFNYVNCKGFPDSSVVNLPARQETQETLVGSLGREDPLEGGMVTYSSILVWRIPWTKEPGGQQSIGLQRVGQD